MVDDGIQERLKFGGLQTGEEGEGKMWKPGGRYPLMYLSYQ
jgi:hypothetical protein